MKHLIFAAVILFAGAASAQDLLDLRNLPVGEHYLKVVVTAEGKRVTVVKPLRIGDTPMSPPVVPNHPDGSIQDFVSKLLDTVPAHENKEDIRKVLAAMYLELADDWQDGKYDSIGALMTQRKSTFTFITKDMYQSQQHWTQFDSVLMGELNRRNPNGDNLTNSLSDIAEGLSKGEAFNPKLIGLVIQLIQARDDPETRRKLLLELLIELVRGRIGG